MNRIQTYKAGDGVSISGDVISSSLQIKRVGLNPDVSVLFPSQEIQTTGMENVSLFIITILERNGTTYVHSFVVATSNSTILDGTYFGAGTGAYIGARDVRVQDGQSGRIKFGNAYYMPTYGSGSSVDNTFAIPYSIYAVK